MDEIKETKQGIRDDIASTLGRMPENLLQKKTGMIIDKLFDFANFLESRISLLYVNGPFEVASEDIIRRSYQQRKIVILPAFDPTAMNITLLKVDHPDQQLKPGPRGVSEPDPKKAKTVPIECIDIAIIPGWAFDEKGGRIGSGRGYYDRFIPDLPITARKVALTFEEQIVPQVPMESHDRFVDIIITDKRIIYKI